MSGVNVIPGRIDPSLASDVDPSFAKVAIIVPENSVVNAPTKNNGAFLGQELTFQPNQADVWEIVGFSVTVRLACSFADIVLPGGRWARFGDIWAGILKDLSPPRRMQPLVPIWPIARFPSDLSTFVKIWSGAEDDIPDVSGQTATGVSGDRVENYALVATNYVLPFPLRVQPGSQLSFALVVTPSVVAYGCNMQIGEVTYAVQYNTIR